MQDDAGKQAWSYDVRGRVVTDKRKTSNKTKVFDYAYNLDGSVQSITYPSGQRVDYSYNAAGRSVSATDVGSGTQLATQATYTPHGALLRMKPRLPIAIGIHLTSPRTGSSTQARVVGFCEPTSKGLLGIAVEFAAPNQGFWGVSFPLAPGTTPSQWPPRLTEADRAFAISRHLTT